MENAAVADMLDEIADLLDLTDAGGFKVRSYQNAARTVRSMSQRIDAILADGGDLTEQPNIGASIAEDIAAIVEGGSCERLESLREEVPAGVVRIMGVPGLGPRKAMFLYRELGVSSLDGLKEAAEAGRIRGLEGMGAKAEENIKRGVETVKRSSGRVSIKAASDAAAALGEHLDGIDAISEWAVAGSLRRREETVGDLDVLIRAGDRSAAIEGVLEYGEIREVQSRGEEKSTVVLRGGLQVDFRFFEASSFGAAMVYFTGSKAHNVRLRRIAIDKGWKLNEYGLFAGGDGGGDGKRLAGKTEASVYSRLGMSFVPPELREDRGEVEAASNGALPELVELGEIRGDMHCHTTATDGSGSIAEMARAAQEMGYEYLAITDHSKAVTMAGGLDDDAMRRHADDIREQNAKMTGFRLFAGVEVDILKSGKLDLEDRTLEGLDWVVASTHYHLNLPREKMTDRLVAAIGSGLVHAIGHPLGRMIGRRDPIKVDLDRVFEACAEHGVCLEINAQPARLDLPDVHCQRAHDAGVRFEISTDAHKADNLSLMDFGVDVARRGWLRKEDVLNTLAVKDLKAAIGAR
jgi:DNA polymerase (family 10)